MHALDLYNPYERVYTTEEFWTNPLGSISIERKLQGYMVAHLRPTTQVLLNTLAALAITKPQGVDCGRGFRLVKEGARKYSLRGLAKACNLAVNTIRRGLKELEMAGLVSAISSTLGTVVEILTFKRWKQNPTCGVRAQSFFKEPRVSNFDPYRSSPLLDLNSLTSIVDVGAGKKEGGTIVTPNSPMAHKVKDLIRSISQKI